MGHLNHADKSLKQRVARLKGQVLALERALDGHEVECLDVLVMKTAQDQFCVGWLASQTDMLADDWYIVE